MPARPPVPEVLKFRLVFDTGGAYLAGFGLHFSYGGTPPGPADLANFCNELAGAWNNHLGGFLSTAYALTLVSGIDLSSQSGAAGEKTVDWGGQDSNMPLALNSAAVVNFGIGRHYRGGKPRCYLPIGTTAATASPHAWTASFVSAVEAAFAAMITSMQNFQSGGCTIDQHVNVSYYEGFTADKNELTGRYRNVPTYRTTPVVDVITSYVVNPSIGSQRRRTLATGH